MKRIKLITCVICVGLLALAAFGNSPLLFGQKVTADHIVAKVSAAMGGIEKIKAMETLRVNTIYGDHEKPVVIEIKRPNLIRTESTAITVFDGKRGCFLKRPPAKDGSPRGPELFKLDGLKEFEVDLAFYVPAFFDHPSTYKGLGEEAGKKVYKLQVNLPLGGRLTYFVDAETFLITGARAHVSMYGGNHRLDRVYHDYKKTKDGILYFRQFSFSFNGGKMQKAVNEKVEINVPLNNSRFAIPEGLK
jgi:hypothetical protein